METYKVIFKEGETTGVYGISLVENPAMDSMFIALKEDTKLQLKAIDTEKRILLGAVLIPEKPIYRNQNGKEFNIVFPAETILLASQNFLKQNYQSSSTLEHNEDMKLSDVTFVESWIKEDMVNDKSVLHGFDEPIGTWFASMKVDNEQVWNDYIKTGKVTGFSIDGFFDLEQINLNKQEMNVNEIVDAIKQGFASLSLKKEEAVNLGSIANEDGSITFNFEGDTIAVGTLMSMTGADGELPVPDGDYTLADGMMVTVVGSTVSEIGTPEAEVEEENAPAPMAAAPTTSPVVKSEKSTQEVFYQLSKEDLNAMTLEFASQLETKISELRNEFKTELEAQAPISLTKNKPAKEMAWEEMTELQKRRATK
jgi:hypothetical protein